VIITGGVNAYHPWWECDYEDSAGKILSRLIDAYNLIIINDRLPTILLPPNAKRSVIDLVLVSANLTPMCYLFTDRDTASDHFPIFISIGGTFSKKHIFASKLKISKKEIDILKRNLNASFVNFETYTSEDIIGAYHQLDKHIR